VFDDQVAEKNQQKIEEYLFAREKLYGLQRVYISQSKNFFGIPTLIETIYRVIILKLSGTKDLKQIIIQNYSLD
jgi:hypothetical protein